MLLSSLIVIALLLLTGTPVGIDHVIESILGRAGEAAADTIEES
jgi:hypothetical protein